MRQIGNFNAHTQTDLPDCIRVARALQREMPIAFFDSSMPGHPCSRESRIAADPVGHCSGNDLQQLDAFVKEYAGKTICAGVFEYEGSFDFTAYSRWITFDHDHATWTGNALAWLKLEPVEAGEFESVHFAALTGREEYCSWVRAAKEYIAAGDIYQVNLARKFQAAWRGDAFALYEKLRAVSPTPFAAWLELSDSRKVLSSSPELFLKINGTSIETRPIKGTRPRTGHSGPDASAELDLTTSAKEAAELIMITDLERNDLGMVAKYGTVQATDLLRLEAFAQVFHLVSTVRAELRDDVTPLQAVTTCLPGGSVTGAPKKRACEIIRELETASRGIYTGAIGWFGPAQTAHFNIAIRTAVIDGPEIHFHTGAGIVADSEPHAEFDETTHKAAGILKAAGSNSVCV